jgi:hypothetical protein
MSGRLWADAPDRDQALAAVVRTVVRAGQGGDDPWAVIVFEREEAQGGRAYLQAELFTGSAASISAQIEDFLGPDGDGDITTESWCETTSADLDPADIDFE